MKAYTPIVVERSDGTGSVRRMEATTVARQIAVARVALGAALTVAPGVFTRIWVGERTTGAKVLGLGFGARDVAIGTGLWHALDSGADTRPWLVAGAAGDVADLVGTLAARRSLSPLGVSVAAVAASGAALSLWAARQVAP
ncbi:hypothetical protein DVA67_012240 [Solirubrobacter sp. CPCC 204708]|uniref:DUF4267 domain-containing protein n=1 Tax=Solirubrobacter deserti TaxID=2282478 RepID=A0ABT4RLQ2_9ACTN|nr:hypothetical protein [Solirubrobacter deserti]MBE2316744.1 hypothetical protein [Solirubrobacter deserti]MDA0139500.1 hypothetical protein [Solirubrobacter deserti]